MHASPISHRIVQELRKRVVGVFVDFVSFCHSLDVARRTWLGKIKEHSRQLKTFQLVLIFKLKGCADVSRSRERERKGDQCKHRVSFEALAGQVSCGVLLFVATVFIEESISRS